MSIRFGDTTYDEEQTDWTANFKEKGLSRSLLSFKGQ